MLPRKIICLICGCSEGDAEKFHYFSNNKDRCQAWLHALGFPSDQVETVISNNARICNRHFSKDSYVPFSQNKWKLRTAAIPIPFIQSTDDKSVETGDLSILSEAGPSTPVPFLIEADTLENVITGQPFTVQHEPRGESPRPSTSTAVPQVSNKRRLSGYKKIPGLAKGDASPRKKHLIRLLESKEAHIRQLKRTCRQKKGDIKALCDLSDSNVVRNLFTGMKDMTKDFLISQLRCCRRSPKGRRWTIQDKVVALALLKKSPRCYSLLSKIVMMPSKRTLLALLEKVPFAPGINEHLFRHIDSCLTTAKDRYCVISFDEMDIKENLAYDKSQDRIVGFEKYGHNRVTSSVANRALVFMCQGLGPRKWKQPVAFYFSRNGCSSEQLKQCLEEVVIACQEMAKIIVVGTICDMGSTNVKTLKELGSCVQQPYVKVNGNKIYTMYDPPHLLKCTVSLFRKYKVILPIEIGGETQTMEANFQHIVHAHQRDKASPLIFRHLHKIKDEHLAPIMRYAMKVCIAAQIMSHSVAAYLFTLVSEGNLEHEALATATFVAQVDQLLDSFNGSSELQPSEGGKPLKCQVTENSPHIQYWRTAFQTINQWQFKRLTKGGQLKSNRPPSQIGWLTSLRAVVGIWNVLKENGFNSLRPRTVTQDPLENIFGCVRGGCGSGDNPTVVQFTAGLKTAILNNLTNQAMSRNCEDDEHHVLSNPHEFINVGEKPSQTVEPVSVSTEIPVDAVQVADQIAVAVRSGQSGVLSVAYVSGFIVKRLLEVTPDCQQCYNDLLSSSDEPQNLFITFKEWSNTEHHLMYPSESFVVAVGHSITILEKVLSENPTKIRISEVARTVMRNEVTFGFNCQIHKELLKELCTTSVCRIGIPWWCKRQNREIKDKKATRKKVRKFGHE